MSGLEAARLSIIINLREGYHTGIFPCTVCNYAGEILTEYCLICEPRSEDAIAERINKNFINNKRFRDFKGILSRSKGTLTISLIDSERVAGMLISEPCYEPVPAEFI